MRVGHRPALQPKALEITLPPQSKSCFARQIQPHFISGRSAPVNRLSVVVIAAMNKVSERSPVLGSVL